jgi:tetratricopeptide (TPR) repeat protein
MGLLSAWRDWRDRNQILRDIKRRQGDADERLVFTIRDQLTYAMTAIEQDDPRKATELWVAVRDKYPKLVYEAPLTFKLLMTLRRFDEADEMMRQGGVRRPTDPFFARGAAEVAQARGNHDKAIELFAALRKRFPGVMQGYVLGASSLAAKGRIDEAEALAEQAMKQFPDELGGFLEHARMATLRRDWAEALRRWQIVSEFGFRGGYIGAAQALVQLGRHDEADALLADARIRSPIDPAPIIEMARGAQLRGDIAEAVKRWKNVIVRFPLYIPGYLAAADAMDAMGEQTEAEAMFRAAIERFPLEQRPIVDMARYFHLKRRDFAAAAEAWALLRQTFSDNEEGYTRGADALRGAGRAEEAAALLAEHRQRFGAP